MKSYNYIDIKKRRCYIHRTETIYSMNHSGFEYEVEGDVDFFSQLKQMTTATTTAPTDANTATTTPRCLITDEILRRDHITLQCGHKFNYVPLFKEVLFQKCVLLPKNLSSNIITTYTTVHGQPSAAAAVAAAHHHHHHHHHHHSSLPTNTSNTSGVVSVMHNPSYNLETRKLHNNEMKCPYCRSVTPNILPYYPYPDVSKVKYVNTPPEMSLPAISCEYEKFISGENTVFATNEPTACRSKCIYNEKYGLMLCNKHLNKIEAPLSATSTSTTKTTTVRTRSTKSKTSDDENIIISHHNPATSVCPFVLLSGPRKGCPCEKPMWIPKIPPSSGVVSVVGLPAYCKAHYSRGCPPGVPPPNGGNYVL